MRWRFSRSATISAMRRALSRIRRRRRISACRRRRVRSSAFRTRPSGFPSGSRMRDDLIADLDHALSAAGVAAALLVPGPYATLPRNSGVGMRPIMCRNIKTLHNFDPPATRRGDPLVLPAVCAEAERFHAAVGGQSGRVRRRREQGVRRRARADRFPRHHRTAPRSRDRGAEGPRAIGGAVSVSMTA